MTALVLIGESVFACVAAEDAVTHVTTAPLAIFRTVAAVAIYEASQVIFTYCVNKVRVL
jgi:hypothetical protein